MEKDIWERYSRQILFAPVGKEGQDKLMMSKVAVLASLQSIEAIKFLTGAVSALQEQLLFFDAWENRISCVEVTRKEDCSVCSRGDYKNLSRGKNSSAAPPCAAGMPFRFSQPSNWTYL